MPLESALALAMDSEDDAVKANLVVKGKFINNGKALGFNVDYKQTRVALTGTVFKTDTFTLRQFHFHIGCEGQKGSEHSLDGERYPGEVGAHHISFLIISSEKDLISL